MVFGLTAVLFMLPTLRFILTPLSGVLWFLVVLTITPRYVGVGLSAEGYALSAQRLLFITFFMLLIGKVITGNASVLGGFNRSTRSFVVSVFFLSAISCVGVFFTEYDSYFTIAFFEQIIVLSVCVYIGWRLSIERDGFKYLLQYAFIIPLCICFVIAGIEIVKGTPLLYGVIAVDENIASLKDFYQIRTRGGQYRVTALFDGSLQVGEFATYSLIAVSAARFSGIINRKLTMVLLVCGALVVFWSGSRSAILISVISSTIFIGFYVFKLRGVGGKIITWSIISSCGAALLVSLYLLVANLQTGQEVYQLENDFERSRYSRLLQYQAMPGLIAESPAVGYGYKRNVTASFYQLQTIDNYYFVILLQAGVIGFLAFLFSIFITMRSSISAAAERSKEMSITGIFVFVFVVAFGLFKLFLSMPDNNAYFYVISIFGLCYWRKGKVI